METLELWTNSGYNIGINSYGDNLLVIASVFDGNSQVITSSTKCKSMVSAKRTVTKKISDYVAVGGKGEFTKVK